MEDDGALQCQSSNRGDDVGDFRWTCHWYWQDVLCWMLCRRWDIMKSYHQNVNGGKCHSRSNDDTSFVNDQEEYPTTETDSDTGDWSIIVFVTVIIVTIIFIGVDLQLRSFRHWFANKVYTDRYTFTNKFSSLLFPIYFSDSLVHVSHTSRVP